MKFSIVIPAKNEAVNLAQFLPRLRECHPDAETIVVDDGSTDDTVAICRENGVRVISHPYSKGNGAAIKTGARAATGSVIVFMDGDGQHNPKYIKKMFKILLNKKTDLVVGARKFEDINESLSLVRFFASKILIFLFEILFKLKTSDPMSGYFLFKKKFYLKNKKYFFGKGYKILADLIYSTPVRLKIIDYKIKFLKRKKEKSKMSLRILLILILFIFSKTISFRK